MEERENGGKEMRDLSAFLFRQSLQPQNLSQRTVARKSISRSGRLQLCTLSEPAREKVAEGPGGRVAGGAVGK